MLKKRPMLVGWDHRRTDGTTGNLSARKLEYNPRRRIRWKQPRKRRTLQNKTRTNLFAISLSLLLDLVLHISHYHPRNLPLTLSLPKSLHLPRTSAALPQSLLLILPLLSPRLVDVDLPLLQIALLHQLLLHVDVQALRTLRNPRKPGQRFATLQLL